LVFPLPGANTGTVVSSAWILLAQCIDQWCEQLAGRSHPTCHRGAIKIDALASVNLCLAIQRAVIGILRDEHMCQQSRSCKATLDHRRFDHTLAPGAGKLRPHMANDLEVSWNVFQYFGYILTEITQRFAAIGAEVLLGMVGYNFAGRCAGSGLRKGLDLGLASAAGASTLASRM
jgi:hypothetical protein